MLRCPRCGDAVHPVRQPPPWRQRLLAWCGGGVQALRR